MSRPEYPPPLGTAVRISHGTPEPAPRNFDRYRVVHRLFETWIDPKTGRQAGRWTWQEGHPPIRMDV